MKRKQFLLIAAIIVFFAGGTVVAFTYFSPGDALLHSTQTDKTVSGQFVSLPLGSPRQLASDPKPLPAYLEKSIVWLVQAQSENGGWGAGSHATQNIRDPHAVQTDPATTAFVGMALIRVGNTLDSGQYREPLRKALHYLLKAVGETPDNSINITTMHGTQPQYKLGQNIDVSMTSQFFSRVLPLTAKQPDTEKQVREALEKCVRIVENSQQTDGSWNTSGWAPVLNSAMAGNSLELAQANGIQVDSLKLAASQRYQRSNVDASGEAKTDKSAGVALYSLSSSQRTNTVMRKKAEKQLEGYTPAAPAQSDIQNELEKKGVAKEEAQALSEAYVAYDAAAKQMVRDDVLSGFGNNGGEEFLSYMMTSESYVTAHDKQWDAWHTKMSGLFEKIQNPDGSWSGHHCITSPVFCTAAVIMTLTPDRDILLAETVAATGK